MTQSQGVVRRLVSLGRNVQRVCKAFAVVAGPCLFSILMVLLPSVMFIWVSQGQEVLRALGEETDNKRHIRFTLAATVIWGWLAWYWARTMVSFYFPKLPDTGLPRKLAEALPRFLAAAPFIAMAIACYRATHLAPTPLRLSMWSLSGTFLAFAAIGWSAARYRRPMVVALGRSLQAVGGLGYGGWSLNNTAIGSKIRTMASAMVTIPRRVPVSQYRTVLELPKLTLLVTGSCVLTSFILFTLFLTIPERAGPWLSAAPILIIAAAWWIPIGSFLIYLRERFVIPVFTLLLVLFLSFSSCNDNHAIRTLPSRSLTPGVGLGVRLHRWQSERGKESGGIDTIPMFFVVAEGGGIRAAYWTAAVLAALQDAYPAFSRHVFVSSGVSGGALGVATFTALIADNNLPCADSSLPNARILHCADRFLAGDFLSPLLGAMLYPDLAQRFAPNLVPWFGKRADRARALEVAWEHQWQDVTNNSRFAEPFADLWSSDTSAIQVPAMFFTGTSVETGKRIIVGAPFGIRFFDSTDWLDSSSGPIALSTAVHMSARFTYFSPAGLLAHGHVVDGGYFDNSGATTALELLQAVMDSLRQDAQPIKPVVIMIENGLESDTVQTFAWLSEVLSPINAVVNARTARASLAKRVLRSEVQAKGGQYLRFALDCHSKPGLKLPLGWTLSALDRVTMLERLDMGCDGGVDNSASRDSVGSLLHPQSNQTPSGDH